MRSTDDGVTWEPLSIGLTSISSGTFRFLPDGRILALGEGKIYQSTDEGETWESISGDFNAIFLYDNSEWTPYCRY